MFVSEADDPRSDGDWGNDERAILLGFLDDRRLTLELKCRGLTAAQMATPSVQPSDLTLLGLVRHLTSVESYWFGNVIAGDDRPRPYHDDAGADRSLQVVATDSAVSDAWAAWRSQVADSNAIIAAVTDLGAACAGQAMPVREVLVHLIREYAQHLGHADLLRERIDGCVGQ